MHVYEHEYKLYVDIDTDQLSVSGRHACRHLCRVDDSLAVVYIHTQTSMHTRSQ